MARSSVVPGRSNAAPRPPGSEEPIASLVTRLKAGLPDVDGFDDAAVRRVPNPRTRGDVRRLLKNTTTGWEASEKKRLYAWVDADRSGGRPFAKKTESDYWSWDSSKSFFANVVDWCRTT